MVMPPRDFYEIQKSQARKSLFLFGLLLGFYAVALGIVALALVWSVGLVFSSGWLHSGHFWTRFLLFDLAAAGVIAGLHFLDARRNGARYILRRLQAVTPDPGDRYHRMLLNTVDEMRIAAGLPRVNTYVLPSLAINSLALIEESGTPAVAVTEGLLADGTRDELEAVAAHELAHIARGDAFYMTLVCSLANLFEKLREALEPERQDARAYGAAGSAGASGAPPVPLYAAVTLSAVVMHLLSTLVSRERELLADAAGVELCRSPEALARAIYKAHVKNSFIGDFSLTYTPLFIVPPDARDISEGLLARAFNSHPPVMKRLGILAAMAGKSPQAVIASVRENERTRGRARGVLYSFEELRKRQLELFPGWQGSSGPVAAVAPVMAAAATAAVGATVGPAGAAAVDGGAPTAPAVPAGSVETAAAVTAEAASASPPARTGVEAGGEADARSGAGGQGAVGGTAAAGRTTGGPAASPGLSPGSAPANGPDAAASACPAADTGAGDVAKIWLLAALAPQTWEGPFSMPELLGRPRFSLLAKLRNMQEGVEAKAREFPQVRAAVRKASGKTASGGARTGLCPRCRGPLAATFYEGVAIAHCPKCGGKLVDMACIERIIARREVAFSEGLLAKTRAFEDRIRLNPLKKMKLNAARTTPAVCPGCGGKMVLRPYNYQYFIPVDKCLGCSKIWFDVDELEMLQILIESRGGGPA